MSKHAILSASGAERWLNCSASARLEEGMPDTKSPYAAEGTLAHAIAELRLRKQYTNPVGPKKYADALKALQQKPGYEPEMLNHVETYYDYVASVVHSYTSPPHIVVESRLDFSHIVPGGFGTGDCIIIGGDTLRIVDFKYGKGVPVSAQNNPQMMLYGLGALKKYVSLFSVKRVCMTIVQPRLDSIDTWECNTVDLVTWGESIKPKAQLAYNGGGPCVAGEWCRWCRAGSTCRARADYMLALEGFGKLLPQLLSNDEIGGILVRAKELAAWATKLEDYALSALLRGEAIPGWKAVEGRSVRAFTDIDAAFKAVIGAGTPEELLYERKPITLTEVEKLLGKKPFNEIAGSYVTKTKGKPTLAPESDKREPYQPSTAAEDFTPLDTSIPGATLIHDTQFSTI